MARKYAGFSKGTLADYASPSRIENLFNNSMKDIRAEASRMRSIIRKRMERMEIAGETTNRSFELFGDRKTSLPSINSMTDAQVKEFMSRAAQQIGGGHMATLS